MPPSSPLTSLAASVGAASLPLSVPVTVSLHPPRASVVPSAKAAARLSRRGISGRTRAEKSAGMAAPQKGHARSVESTWRAQAGHGQSGRYMDLLRGSVGEPAFAGLGELARPLELVGGPVFEDDLP